MNWLREKGTRAFFVRTAIFVGIVLGVYMFIFLYFRHTPFFLKNLVLGEQYYIPFLTGLRKTDFLNAVIFSGILFIIWNRGLVSKIPYYDQPWKQTIVLGALSAVVLVGHYALKYVVNSSQMDIPVIMVLLLKYGLNILFIALLALSVYSTRLIKSYKTPLMRQLPIFFLIMVAYFFLIQFFQTIWRLLGNMVATILYHLLSINHDAYLNVAAARAPILGVGDFIVGISEECSGIDSLLLFLSLYTALLVMDWKRMHPPRAAILFAIGILGTVAYNILRIYLLMLVGIYYSPQFALDAFHTNAGWILFLLFFIVFWHFGSKWIYKKIQPASN